ncbi:MAG: BatD family protein [Halobacteriovoraceae bacterium]|nr:BatD family protein [Halobacteriovoraceae bacterium]
MKRLLVLIFITLSSQLWASDKVTIIPDSKDVSLEEVFGITFRIETESDDEPEIKFDPYGLDVLEKSNEGVSSTTTYINGKLSSKREYIIRYQVKSNILGNVSLRNIEIKAGNEIIKHSNIYINSAREAEKNRNIFIQAEPSETNVYKGQGIMLRYFLYYKVRITSQNIKQFPKLNGFMKRYFQENPYRERINHNGEMFERMLLYSTVIFPEKLGETFIDPLIVEISYPSRTSNSPFGSFGMGFQNIRKKTYSSKRVAINVKPLPTSNVPEGFTGLVGSHSFKLTVLKNKFLVNEPVELKLVVKGEGNLENYSGPSLINDPALEEFENNSNLETTNTVMATKTFQYTYLARKNGKIDAKKVPLAYFDPAKNTYVTEFVEIPEMTIEGTASAGVSHGNGNVITQNSTQGNSGAEIENNQIALIGPYFENSILKQLFSNYFKIVNILLIVGIIFVFLMILKPILKFNHKDEIDQRISKIKKSNLGYTEVYNFLDKIEDSNRSLLKKIENAEISPHAKKYFENILTNREDNLFGDRKHGKNKLAFKEKYFKEVGKLVKAKHENRKESTRFIHR